MTATTDPHPRARARIDAASPGARLTGANPDPPRDVFDAVAAAAGPAPEGTVSATVTVDHTDPAWPRRALVTWRDADRAPLGTATVRIGADGRPVPERHDGTHGREYTDADAAAIDKTGTTSLADRFLTALEAELENGMGAEPDPGGHDYTDPDDTPGPLCDCGCPDCPNECNCPDPFAYWKKERDQASPVTGRAVVERCPDCPDNECLDCPDCCDPTGDLRGGGVTRAGAPGTPVDYPAATNIFVNTGAGTPAETKGHEGPCAGEDPTRTKTITAPYPPCCGRAGRDAHTWHVTRGEQIVQTWVWDAYSEWVPARAPVAADMPPIIPPPKYPATPNRVLPWPPTVTAAAGGALAGSLFTAMAVSTDLAGRLFG